MTAAIGTTAAAAPRHIGKVVLTVHDLDAVSAFYRQAVGLHELSSAAGALSLGAGATTLIELRRDPAARRRSPGEAGLFHTAFLLPTRADLGCWTRHAMRARTPVVGSADHLVSEAIYLTDPEGNGVEIYADRPSSAWTWQDGLVRMSNDRLDFDGLVAAAGARDWQGAPAGSIVGHVHLQVGAIPPAEAFYAGELGFPVTCRFPGGTFYGSGCYHHHLATNTWNSRGAAARSQPSTGLTDVEIIAADLDAVSRTSFRDPWGTSITLVAARSGHAGT